MMLSALLALAMMGPAEPQQNRDVTEVEGLVAQGVRSRIPITNDEFRALARSWTVPHYSVEQAASFVCMARRGYGYNLQVAQRAQRATQAFEDVKIRVREGKATMEDLVKADAERQAAVRQLFLPQPADRMDARAFASGAGRRTATPRVQTPRRPPGMRAGGTGPGPEGLVVESTDYRIETRNGEQVLVARVVFRNDSDRPVRPAHITIAALDRRYLTLADEAYELGGQTLQPGQRGQGEFVFANMPYYTHDIRVHFGPSTAPRNYRGCSVMEPFHPPGGLNMKLASEDEVQDALDALPER